MYPEMSLVTKSCPLWGQGNQARGLMGRAVRLPSQLMLGSLGAGILEPRAPRKGSSPTAPRSWRRRPPWVPSTFSLAATEGAQLPEEMGISVTGHKDAEMSWQVQDLSCRDTPLHGLPAGPTAWGQDAALHTLE